MNVDTPATGLAEPMKRGWMDPAATEVWAEKARRLVQPLVQLPHASGTPSIIEVASHPDPHDSQFGQWMLTWPELGTQLHVIHHLCDGNAFLKLLDRTYAPVLKRTARLHHLLDNRSRLEMSITNDVLQVQLPAVSTYSMIRHHALMLFEATLWLDHSTRVGWGELYSEVADFAMADRRAVPSVAELADIESAGFEAMRNTAEASADPLESNRLLSSTSVQPIVEYQIWATVGLAVLWRDFAAREAPDEMLWHDRQLACYQEETYLTESLNKWL